jgi:tripartite motif-containing protein 71
LNNPHGLALDSSRGILYIADTYNHRIISYRISLGPCTAAGGGCAIALGTTPGTQNNQLNSPTGIYLDGSSNSLYIANSNANNIVRWALNASTWTLIAGNANGQYGPTSTTLNSPTDLTFDYLGNLYVADSGNNRIQFFLPGQFNGTTIAGITSVYTTAANTLDSPQSMALDSSLNLYVVDSGNNRIQKFVRY